MSAPRVSHSVEASGEEIRRAIANGTTLTASCGAVWVPVAGGKDADSFPTCVACYPEERKRAVPTYVYRCYDASDRLLYVGCTVSPRSRIDTHRSASWWFHQVARVRFTVFPHKDYGLRMERQAIGEENPRWNVMGRWPRRALWTVDDYRDYYTACSRTSATYTPKVQKHLAVVAAECLQRFGVEIEEVAA